MGNRTRNLEGVVGKMRFLSSIVIVLGILFLGFFVYHYTFQYPDTSQLLFSIIIDIPIPIENNNWEVSGYWKV